MVEHLSQQANLAPLIQVGAAAGEFSCDESGRIDSLELAYRRPPKKSIVSCSSRDNPLSHSITHSILALFDWDTSPAESQELQESSIKINLTKKMIVNKPTDDFEARSGSDVGRGGLR